MTLKKSFALCDPHLQDIVIKQMFFLRKNPHAWTKRTSSVRDWKTFFVSSLHPKMLPVFSRTSLTSLGKATGCPLSMLDMSSFNWSRRWSTFPVTTCTTRSALQYQHHQHTHWLLTENHVQKPREILASFLYCTLISWALYRFYQGRVLLDHLNNSDLPRFL